MHTAHTRVHTFTLACARTLCGALGEGKGGAGAPPGVRGAGIPGAPRPVRPRAAGGAFPVSRESVNTPPPAAQRRPQWPGTAAADPAFRRALHLTPPPPGPLRHPAPAWRDPGGAGRGGPTCRAGLRAAAAREPGLCGVGAGPLGSAVELPAPRGSPHLASLMLLQPRGELQGGGTLAPAPRSSPPVPLVLQAALGNPPPGHPAHRGSCGSPGLPAPGGPLHAHPLFRWLPPSGAGPPPHWTRPWGWL